MNASMLGNERLAELSVIEEGGKARERWTVRPSQAHDRKKRWPSGKRGGNARIKRFVRRKTGQGKGKVTYNESEGWDPKEKRNSENEGGGREGGQLNRSQREGSVNPWKSGGGLTFCAATLSLIEERGNSREERS